MKTIMGIVTSLLFVAAGVFQFAAGKPILGALFIVVAIAFFIINNKLKNLNKGRK